MLLVRRPRQSGRARPLRARGVAASSLALLGSAAAALVLLRHGLPHAFAPVPPGQRTRPQAPAPGRADNVQAAATKAVTQAAPKVVEEADGEWLRSPLTGGLLGVMGGVAFAEGGLAPQEAAIDKAAGTVLGPLLEHHGSTGEDIFLAALVCITAYCLVEMGGMQMKCPHWEARLHVFANAGAAFCSLYGILMERVFRESPDLWWAVLTPLLYGVSNLTMAPLMAAYKGPQAYSRLFELGQSFTLSFQGIHLLAWSSVHPALYWAAMPFWYYSLKKFWEQVVYMLDLVPGESESQKVEAHRSRSQTWGAFGLELDALTIGFAAVNFAAALADNAYMGVYTLRGPEGFFEASRDLISTGGWGSDHLRMALVKPAVGSLVLSMAVFLGTLCSRRRLPLAVGVPVSAVLSALGPWLVFFWHRLVDPTEPWLPELLGEQWGPLAMLGA